MIRQRRRHTETGGSPNRRGAALVEFAIVAPVLFTLVIGTIEIGAALRAATILNAAVREGGRLAAMDFSDKLGPNESPTDKIRRDIQNFASAAGISGRDIVVSITSAEGSDSGSDFDLNEPDNHLRLFRITATIPYDSISLTSSTYYVLDDLKADVVFRKARSSLAN